MTNEFVIEAKMPGCVMYISSSKGDVTDKIENATKFKHGEDNPKHKVLSFNTMTGIDIWRAVLV